jgi:hypothetical protein
VSSSDASVGVPRDPQRSKFDDFAERFSRAFLLIALLQNSNRDADDGRRRRQADELRATIELEEKV